MARVDADRNLLLGILAQQMDFVSRDALFAAMNAWIIRKETPLGALLVERGDLAKSRCNLLEALVDEHVRAHAGDPARSLQALSSVGSVADDLGRLSDPDLRASLGHLPIPRAALPSTDDLATRAPGSLGEPTSWNGRFRVVRPHASGGLGIVSVALDDELDREVAFKEIKDKFADDDDRRTRFVLEAEITGKLEHPGIIPIYGLGHDPSGRPFYAMRFIRGDSLADAINRFHDPNGPHADPAKKSSQLRELLGRFLDVCDALAYAHSRGVLHRDLKPGNVMLGPFGETLVVDWGLALPLDRVPDGLETTQGPVKPTKADSSSLPREHGQAVGTPAYMPPEQAEGSIDQLGPRSDVYGLGAILYDLLTGKHPVEGASLEEVLRRVGRGEIKPPRQVRPEIPADLEAICLKALALKPEGRYATPRALAADIKAWLADDPVSARPEPLAERARRWAKRNRTAVTAAAASLLVGLVGLGAVATVQTRARGDLARKNAALDMQRGRAEAREAQAIAAVKQFGDVIANEPELKKTPALEGLRKRLLNEPLAFFRALREQLQSDRDTRPESLQRLAQAGFDLGSLTNEIGDKQDALIAYREALAIQRKLADANPSVTRYQSDLAGSHNSIGILLSETGQPAEALKAHELALAIRRKLADANPSVTRYQNDLAGSHNNIGNLLSETGQPAEALKAYESALAIRRKLADANPSVTEFQNDLASSHNNIGILLSETGQPAGALKAHESALAIRRKLADANPSVTKFQSDLAGSHNNIGNLLNVIGQPAEALKAYESALAIQQKLADANPSVTEFQSDLASSHYNIGNLLSETGQPAEALKAYESALAIRRKLVREHPEFFDFASALGNTLNHIAIGDLKANRFEEARIRLRQAVDWQRKALASNPKNPIYRQFLANHLQNMIRAARGLGDSEGVAEAERALAELRESDPANIALDARLIAIHRGDQQPRDNAERLQLAQRAYDKALQADATKLWADALEADPKLAEDRRAQVRYNAACAAALGGCGRGKDNPAPDDAAKAKLRERARAWLQAELAAWTGLVESGPPEARPVVAPTLQHWKENGALAGVREAKALEALHEAEREPWRALWAGVDTLLVKAQDKAPTAPVGKE